MANAEGLLNEQVAIERDAGERAVLVGAPGQSYPPAEAAEHLAELGRLTDTAGGVVVGTVVQRVRSPQPRYYVGTGKAKELAEQVRALDADLVVFDDELTPAQGKNLEDLLKVRVVDRTELILAIFANRARTYEARLQVELAQLQYLLPRLMRMWSHLSRIRGGIGLRGPGETQLETDRRLVGTRIADLRRKLGAVAQARAVQRKSREGRFRAALVGYTNAGKSSLLQALSGSRQFVEDRLFATLDSSTRAVPLGDGHEALVTDTVGFIRKLPHHLVASFRSTLEEAREADVLLHVIDSSHRQWREQQDVVRSVLKELDLLSRPRVLVFNKTDLLNGEQLLALKRQAASAGGEGDAVFVSARVPATLIPLRDGLAGRMQRRMRRVRVEVPVSDGGTLAALHREGVVLSQEQNGATLSVVVRVPAALAGRLDRADGVRVTGA